MNSVNSLVGVRYLSVFIASRFVKMEPMVLGRMRTLNVQIVGSWFGAVDEKPRNACCRQFSP